MQTVKLDDFRINPDMVEFVRATIKEESPRPVCVGLQSGCIFYVNGTVDGVVGMLESVKE